MQLSESQIKTNVELLTKYRDGTVSMINICDENIRLYTMQKQNPYAPEKIERSKKTKAECLDKIKKIDDIIETLQKE